MIDQQAKQEIASALKALNEQNISLRIEAAKRLGGGRNVGTQRESVQQQAPRPPQQQAATPTVVAAQPTVKHGDLDTAGGDNIEKEWVDRADTIIKQHSADPYLEEEEHEDLSAAYLKKRFNLDIKRSDPKP